MMVLALTTCFSSWLLTKIRLSASSMVVSRTSKLVLSSGLMSLSSTKFKPLPRAKLSKIWRTDVSRNSSEIGWRKALPSTLVLLAARAIFSSAAACSACASRLRASSRNAAWA